MIVTSPDGQWAAFRRGREVALLASGAGPAVGMLGLDGDEVDLALVGPPSVLVAVTRDGSPRAVLHQPPYLEAVARLDFDVPMRLAAATGPRMAMVSLDGKLLLFVRAAGRSLTAQPIEVTGPVEFAVGLERNQMLVGLQRKLEVWDAVSGRPLLRLQLQLPPPPRTVGAAHGHIWCTRPGSDEVLVYRLSDGRPFRHYAGSPVEDVVCHPASPLIVLVTAKGLVRLHCFAHSLSLIDAPWIPGMPLGQLAVGDDVSLLGLADGASEPWRTPIAGAGAATIPLDAGDIKDPVVTTIADKLRGPRERAEAAAPAPVIAPAGRPTPMPSARPISPATRGRPWRDPLAPLGAELARGVEVELPILAVDTELGELAHRLNLGTGARRALIALYSLYLVGEAAVSIAQLARVLGDWTEPLGQGELAALAMISRTGGRVSLRSPVTDLLDGAPPREIRIAGGPAGAPRAGAFRVARDGKSDAELEAELATRLGRIAVIAGDPDGAIVEARLHGATAVAFHPPEHRPRPWPRDAGLVLVLYGSATSWVADLPTLEGATVRDDRDRVD